MPIFFGNQIGNMNQKSKAAFIITACLLVAVHSDQNLDCRKMVYSRHCRGVAIKRGDIRNIQKQPGAFDDNFSLKRLLLDLSTASETYPANEEISQTKKPDERLGTEQQKDNADLDRLLYKLLLGFKRRNNEIDNTPLFEY